MNQPTDNYPDKSDQEPTERIQKLTDLSSAMTQMRQELRNMSIDELASLAQEGLANLMYALEDGQLNADDIDVSSQPDKDASVTVMVYAELRQELLLKYIQAAITDGTAQREQLYAQSDGVPLSLEDAAQSSARRKLRAVYPSIGEVVTRYQAH